MENQTGIPDNQEKMSEPVDRKKRIVKWVVIGVAAFFLLMILTIVGILVSIFITSKNLEKQKNKNNASTGQKTVQKAPDSDNIFARKSLFYDLAAEEIVPASDCDNNESALNSNNPGAGKAVCMDLAASTDIFPTVDPGICDGDTYTIAVSDPTPADGLFHYEFSCKINGELYTVRCGENGCVR